MRSPGRALARPGTEVSAMAGARISPYRGKDHVVHYGDGKMSGKCEIFSDKVREIRRLDVALPYRRDRNCQWSFNEAGAAGRAAHGK